jgi:hypothetical protein
MVVGVVMKSARAPISVVITAALISALALISAPAAQAGACDSYLSAIASALSRGDTYAAASAQNAYNQCQAAAQAAANAAAAQQAAAAAAARAAAERAAAQQAAILAAQQAAQEAAASAANAAAAAAAAAARPAGGSSVNVPAPAVVQTPVQNTSSAAPSATSGSAASCVTPVDPNLRGFYNNSTITYSWTPTPGATYTYRFEKAEKNIVDAVKEDRTTSTSFSFPNTNDDPGAWATSFVLSVDVAGACNSAATKRTLAMAVNSHKPGAAPTGGQAAVDSTGKATKVMPVSSTTTANSSGTVARKPQVRCVSRKTFEIKNFALKTCPTGFIKR